jgi:hypothetical protein
MQTPVRRERSDHFFWGPGEKSGKKLGAAPRKRQDWHLAAEQSYQKPLGTRNRFLEIPILPHNRSLR